MSSKITMVMVSSLNGKITRETDPNIYQWTSPEDSQMFFDLIKHSDVLIMGSKTYQAVKSKINLSSGPLRLIVTKNPDKFKSDFVANKLEFVSDITAKFINTLKSKYQKILLVGGSQINSLFLKLKSVDELYLTVEPLIFGSGKNLIAKSNLNINCNLLKIKKLNKKGTLLLIYKINYEKN